MKNIRIVAASLWTLTIVILCAGIAYSAVKSDAPGSGTYGATAVNTTATEVFTGMVGRNAFAIQNLGPDPLYCGWNSSVTSSTGFQVPVNATLSVDMAVGTAGSGTNTARLYCLTAVLQVSPANTRWIQVK